MKFIHDLQPPKFVFPVGLVAPGGLKLGYAYISSLYLISIWVISGVGMIRTRSLTTCQAQNQGWPYLSSQIERS